MMRRTDIGICLAACLLLLQAAHAQESTPQPESTAASETCTLSFTESADLYSDPREDAATGAQIGADEILQPAGSVSGWWALPSGGASAGGIGTLLLSWIPMSAAQPSSDACADLPVFYPLLYSGEVCTALAVSDALMRPAPDSAAAGEPIGGLLVEVLAQHDGWLAFDPAYSDLRGGARLQWIAPETVELTNGNCAAVPEISAEGVEFDDSARGTPVTLDVGDTLTVALEGNPTTGYIWKDASDPAAHAIVQPQGDFVYVADASVAVGSGGRFVLTLVAAVPGEAELRFGYARSFEPNVEPLDALMLTVTVGSVAAAG